MLKHLKIYRYFLKWSNENNADKMDELNYIIWRYKPKLQRFETEHIIITKLTHKLFSPAFFFVLFYY